MDRSFARGSRGLSRLGRTLPSVIVALLLAAMVAAASPVAMTAQDTPADPTTSGGQPPVWVFHRWLETSSEGEVVGHPVLLRLDPVTGEPTGRIEIDATDCAFEQLTVAPDGPAWLVDSGWPGIYDPMGRPLFEAARHCIGYVPTDGSASRIIELPGNAKKFWDVVQVAALGDDLWLVVNDDAQPIYSGPRQNLDLYKVDGATGAVELVRKKVSGAAAADGSLYVVDSSKANQDAAGVLAPDGTSIEPVDVPLRKPKKKDDRLLRVLGSDGAISFLEPTHELYHVVPATGETTTTKVRAFAPTYLEGAGDGLWILEGRDGFGLTLKHAPLGGSLKATEIAGGPYYAVAGVSPESIWLLGRTDEMVTMGERQFPVLAVTRVDAATLEPVRLASLPWTPEEMPPVIGPGG